jgi:hypothetical protein
LTLLKERKREKERISIAHFSCLFDEDKDDRKGGVLGAKMRRLKT